MRSPVLAFVSLALLAACTGEGSSKPVGSTGGTFIFAAPGDAVDILPPFVTEGNGGFVRDLIFDHLADISMDLKTAGDKGFTPRLAKSWDWAPDSLSIAFHLDPRARWHDGKPVTAADVRYSFKAFTDPKAASPNAAFFANLDSVSAKDSLTAVVWFKKHTPEQFYDVAFQLSVMPEHVYGSIPLDSLRMSSAARTPIGSGQFRFVQWKPDVRLELDADTANYHGRPGFDRVIMTPTTNAAARRTQLLTGEADYVQNYPVELLPELDSSKIGRALFVPSLQYAFMGMNPYAPKSNGQPHPLFSDARVRRALSMGVDRNAILQSVFGGKGLLAHGPFPMSLSAADSSLKLLPYDTAAASALLDSAGWRRGPDGVRVKNGTRMRFNLIYPAPSVPRRSYAVLIQSQLGRLGVQIDIEAVDTKVFTEAVQPGKKAGNFDAILQAFNTDPSPAGMRQNWGTAGIGPQGQNFLAYRNAKVDALVDSMAASFDPAKVKQYASRAFQQIINDTPAIWLYDISEIDAVNRRITIGPLRADGWWETLAQWSIPPNKRIARDSIGLNATPLPH